MIRGKAGLLEPGGDEHAEAVRLLRGKYHQYERMRIEETPVIAIRTEKTVSWGDLDAPDTAGLPLLDAIYGRRSVRKYLDKAVPEGLVDRVLDAARWAPSPHGRQPWRFAVLTRPGAKARLADAMGEEWRKNLRMDGQEAGIVEKRLEGSRRRLFDAPVLVLLCLYTGDLDGYPDPRSARGRDYDGGPEPGRRGPEPAARRLRPRA